MPLSVAGGFRMVAHLLREGWFGPGDFRRLWLRVVVEVCGGFATAEVFESECIWKDGQGVWSICSVI